MYYCIKARGFGVGLPVAEPYPTLSCVMNKRQSLFAGEIQCACTTPECIAQGQETCEAKYYCYVEFRISRKQPFPTDRGCIDDESPRNCAGRLPRYLDGPDSRWSHLPFMYCCSDSWCNTVKHMTRQSRRSKSSETESEID